MVIKTEKLSRVEFIDTEPKLLCASAAFLAEILNLFWLVTIFKPLPSLLHKPDDLQYDNARPIYS